MFISLYKICFGLLKFSAAISLKSRSIIKINSQHFPENHALLNGIADIKYTFI